MKIKKLNLNELHVKSFITSMDDKNADTLKGGSNTSTTTTAVVVGTAGAAAVSYYVCEQAYNAVIEVANAIEDALTTNDAGFAMPKENSMCCSYLQGCVNSYDPGCLPA
jgi:hypothetical protein